MRFNVVERVAQKWPSGTQGVNDRSKAVPDIVVLCFLLLVSIS